MLEYKDILNLSYYEYGEAFSGSLGKLRYRIALEPQRNYKYSPIKEGEEVFFRLFCWFGEYSFDKTKEDEIEIKDYPYSLNSLRNIVDDINKKLQLSKEA